MNPTPKHKQLLIIFAVIFAVIGTIVLITAIDNVDKPVLKSFSTGTFSIDYPSEYRVVRKAGSNTEFINPKTEDGGTFRIQRYANSFGNNGLENLRKIISKDSSIKEKVFNNISMLESRAPNSNRTYYLEHEGVIWSIEFEYGKKSILSSLTDRILGSLEFKESKL